MLRVKPTSFFRVRYQFKTNEFLIHQKEITKIMRGINIKVSVLKKHQSFTNTLTYQLLLVKKETISKKFGLSHIYSKVKIFIEYKVQNH